MKLVILIALVLIPIAATAETATGTTLDAEYVMELQLETSPPQVIGTRLIVPVTGGTFTGPKLSGKVLDVGADWITRRDDDVSELDVRITLETADDALIYLSYQGMIRRADGETYWKMVPMFETAAESYDWLEQSLFIGVGGRVDGRTTYSIYRLR